MQDHFSTTFLVLIDAYLKWIEVFPVNAATSKITNQHLRTVSAQFGIPDSIVMDNGTCFTSSEFEQFLINNDKAVVLIS